MAVRSQFACKPSNTSCLLRTFLNLPSLDRTLKGIGIVDAAPVYESLPGFGRSVLSQRLHRQLTECRNF